jgi:23S rRNA pseudouridine1911/1915/1917 synthase
MEKFVDRLFESQNQSLSRKKIRNLIDQGYARLNGHVHRIATTLCKKSDRVSLVIPQEPKKPSTKLPIVYEDDYIEVIDKPVGLESNPLKIKGIVHRLDKMTSGLLIRAKTAPAEAAFLDLFKHRKIEKTYLAIVHNEFLNPITVDLPIGRIGRVEGFERFGVDLRGKSAITDIMPVSHLKSYTLLKCYPKTGRTHQIRVHLQALGFPIVGDLLYGKEKQTTPRMFLHAQKLSFEHPFLHHRIEIETQIPEDFLNFLEIG